MPVITVQMHKVDTTQKTELIRRLTATAVGVTQVPASSFTIIIQELDDGNIGIGGKTRAEVVASR